MTDIDESETLSKAKALWAKPPYSRDRYLTQPAEAKGSSNIDKNYEELTQRRGATEGALSSKIKRWESWGRLRIRNTEDTSGTPDTEVGKGGGIVTTKSAAGSRHKPNTARASSSPGKPPLPGRSWSMSRITLPQANEEEVEKRKAQFTKNLQVWKGEEEYKKQLRKNGDPEEIVEKSEKSEKPEKSEKSEKPEKSEKKEEPGSRFFSKSPSLSKKSKITSEKSDTKKGKDSSLSRSLVADNSGSKATPPVESKHTTRVKERSESMSSPDRRRRPRPSVDQPGGSTHNRTPIKETPKDEKVGGATLTGSLNESGGDVGKSKSKRSTVGGDWTSTDSDDDGKKFEERRKRLDERKRRLRDREAEEKARIEAEVKPDEKNDERKEKLAQAAAVWKKKNAQKKLEDDRQKQEEEKKRKEEERKNKESEKKQQKNQPKQQQQPKQQPQPQPQQQQQKPTPVPIQEEVRKPHRFPAITRTASVPLTLRKKNNFDEDPQPRKEENYQNSNNNNSVEEDIVEEEEEEDAVVDKVEPPDPGDDVSDGEEVDPVQKAVSGIRKNSITTVDLKMESLDDESVAEILKSLLQNTSVSNLLLDGNDMEGKSFWQLNELLLRNTNLCHLSLNFVMLGEHGSQTIIKGLATNRTVKFLSVSGNDLFENGMAALGAGLKQNTGVNYLNLSENSISDAGCKSLSDIMAVNKSVTSLDISNNYINEEGASHLGEMLMTNRVLKILNLERNSLENEGCIVLASALHTNDTLEELFLGNNIIETDGMLALADALMKNSSLKRVDLRQNILDIESEIALQEVIIKKNGSLSIFWKSPLSKSDPPMGRGDIQAIIEHFGADMIVDVYKNNQALEPLVDLELVLTHLKYSQAEAQKMWDIVFADQGSGFRYPLDLLIRIVQHQVADASPNREFCKIFAADIDRVCSILKPEPENDRLLFSKFQLFQLVKYLVKMDDPQVVVAITKSNLLTSITELFFRFSGNSLYLSQVVEFVEYLATSASSVTFTLLLQFLIQGGFLERFVALYTKESEWPVPKHSGNFGHMTKIANKILEASGKNKKLEKLLEGVQGWPSLSSAVGHINEINQIPEDLKPSESTSKDKKPPGEFDDSLM